MLVCYLDDSGKDPQSRITNIGGYIAREDEWKAFESEVEPYFAEFRVKILHASHLHGTRGECKGWRVLRKHAFVARIFQVMSRHVPLGLAAGAVQRNLQKTSKGAWRQAYRHGLHVLLQSSYRLDFDRCEDREGGQHGWCVFQVGKRP